MVVLEMVGWASAAEQQYANSLMSTGVDPQVAIAAAAVAAAAQTTSIWNTIILGLIGLATTTISSITMYLMAKLKQDTSQTVVNTQDTKQAAETTAVSIEKVHVAVNSERIAMIDEISQLRNTILQMTKDANK